jgi:hypothetical protein
MAGQAPAQAIKESKMSLEELRLSYMMAASREPSVGMVRPGVYKVTWTPNETGCGHLHMCVDGVHAPGSPLAFRVLFPEQARLADAQQQEQELQKQQHQQQPVGAPLTRMASIEGVPEHLNIFNLFVYISVVFVWLFII